jgi:hypothetical protein
MKLLQALSIQSLHTSAGRAVVTGAYPATLFISKKKLV